MSHIEESVKDAVREVLMTEHGIFHKARIVAAHKCSTCGGALLPSVDYKGEPNGFYSHLTVDCIGSLKERLEELSALVKR